MSALEPKNSKSQGARLAVFRVLAGILFVFAVLGLASLAVGVYYTVAKSSRSGWFPTILIGGLGIAVVLMAVVGIRALRIKTLEELEEQSKSKWLRL
jgi:ABC-type antimicrobial peptide transport system permease subunit